MNVLVPMTIVEADLLATSVPINTEAAWDSATLYDPEDVARVGSTLYEALVANDGVDPETDDGTTWLKLGPTNVVRPFDGRIGTQCTLEDDISYTIKPNKVIDGVAFFGVQAAAVQVIVRDAENAVVYDREVQIVDRTKATNFFSWHFDPIEFSTEAIILGVPGYPSNTVEVIVKGEGERRVGQIVLGRNENLGTTIVGTVVGFEDFSRKERDQFGNVSIVERAFARTVDFQFAFSTDTASRVMRIVTDLRITPAVWFDGDEDSKLATTIFGFPVSFSPPLTTNVSYATLEIEGLV